MACETIDFSINKFDMVISQALEQYNAKWDLVETSINKPTETTSMTFSDAFYWNASINFVIL